MSSTIYKNEIIKRKFYEYLLNSKGFSTLTVQCYEDAIYLWEDYTGKADFANFTKTKAEDFKVWLKNKKKMRSEEKVSLSYCYDNLRHLKTFFDWLSKQSGYRSKINQIDYEYLNLSKQEARIATQPKHKQCPNHEEVKAVIENIKGKTEVEMRDKALISLTLLTGARISAISSLPMQSFDRVKLTIDQDPRLGVKTKFSKRIITTLIPFGYKESLDYFVTWFDYLEKQKKFSANDPIFPATKVENGKENLGYFSTNEVAPIYWNGSASARKVFEKRFNQANVTYYHPHTFRHLLVKTISKLPLTEEQKKAISQNLGHEDVGTTFGSYGYGKISEDRQVEIIAEIDFDGKKQEVKYVLGTDDIKELMREMRDSN
ncbi:MAG: tyrosine-type recombinase/integrase [Patescibacteria group bacterium]